MFVKHADVEVEDVAKGITRKILASEGKLMSLEVTFEQDAVAPLHSHPHEQIGYVIKGRFEATLGDEKTIVQAGDTYYVPPNLVHGVVALEEGMLFDIFTPQREDYLKPKM